MNSAAGKIVNNFFHDLGSPISRWLGELRPFPTQMKILFFISAFSSLTLNAATILPIGPISFNSNSDYDNNFKESPSFSGAFRSSNGYLEVSGVPNATAAFDTSATGGANGFGGSGGSDTNNDLSNFTISAAAASFVAGGIGVGFLLRMNGSESNGYLAAMLTQGTSSVTFNVYEGAGLNTAGTPIFGSTVALSGLSVAANTFYPFKVTIAGGAFSFDFGSGAATASFTDTTVSAITGQAGFSLATLSPTSATRLDNFTIVPEPSPLHLAIFSLAGCIIFQFNRRQCRERSRRRWLAGGRRGRWEFFIGKEGVEANSSSGQQVFLNGQSLDGPFSARGRDDGQRLG